MENALVVLSTFPNIEEARRVSEALVNERLAACANILPGVESIYRWQGAVEKAAEVMVVFKTNIDRYFQLESRIKALHSYEVPEVLALRAHSGSLAYLRWIEDCCAQSKGWHPVRG